MAEYLRDVPTKYGQNQEGYHPRIHSYGRRIMTVLPMLVLAAVLVLLLFYRRPAPALSLIAVLLIVVALTVAYSVLAPASAALTDTHLLRGRPIGWKAVPRARIKDAVFVARLKPKAALSGKDSALHRFRTRGVPALWFLGENGRPVLRFDGRIWDEKTLRTISAKLTQTTTVYQEANVVDIDRKHPHLITFHERHPRFRSGLITVLSVVFVGFIVVLNLWPQLLQF